MPIPVSCPSCKTKFTVSDRFAGKQGPCPKCKAKITIPKLEDLPPPQEEVKVHAPEEYSTGPKGTTGRSVTKPIARQETRLRLVPALVVVAAVATTFVVTRVARQPLQQHVWLRAIALLLVSPAIAVGGYSFLRDDELEPHRGVWLWLRASICAAAYLALWGIYFVLLPEMTETWHWMFVGPPFFLIGAGVALATFDLDYGSGFFHYSLYVLVTLTLGYAAGLAMPWSPSRPQKLSASHLHNAYRIHAKVISGGQPDGEAGFRELRELGVKTVISVDGARPDVVLAKNHGLRYVHLPHGYDGISQQRVKELAKAVRDLDGPIYIHCHHGKHRSPTAAVVACVSVGFVQPSAARDVLQMAGTSENYRGLYESAEAARRLDDALLDQLQVEYRETVDLPALAAGMVSLEATHDHIKAMAAAGWRSPTHHPDLDPAHEALLLREHFTELLRIERVRREPQRFQQLLRDSEAASAELENALYAWNAAENDSPPPPQINEAFERVSHNCTACHRAFRDVPSRKKQKR